MSNGKSKASELAMKVMAAKSVWEDKKLQREQADTEYEYAEKLLVLARQELELQRRRVVPYEDWDLEVTQGIGYPEEVLAELESVELVGEPIGTAARTALARLSKASVEDLVTAMRRRGFQFATDAPAREIHGALLKQTWARKDSKTEKWEYVRDGKA